ncbi:MAG: hypothetical protein QOD12_772 [Verrucomicrobiota bacterium]|jgi:hypothetical protein
MSSSRVLALVSVLAVAPFVHAQGSGDKEKQLVYNDITEGSGAIDRDAKKAYAGKLRFIDVKRKDGFSPGGLKGLFTSQLRFRDPRSMRLSAIPGKVVYTFIVTPDGRVLDPRILHSTDERVSKYLIERISNERYFPARFRGVPVYSLHGDEWEFGGSDATGPSQNNDGLGIMRNRDR